MYICKKIRLSHWSGNKGKNFLMAYLRNLSYIIFCRTPVTAGVEESSIPHVTIGVPTPLN